MCTSMQPLSPTDVAGASPAAIQARHQWQDQPDAEIYTRQAKVAKEWLYQQCCRVRLVLLLMSGAPRVQGRKQERSDAGTQPGCGCATTAHGYAEGSVKEGLPEVGNVPGGGSCQKGGAHRQTRYKRDRSGVACRLRSEESCLCYQG